MAGNLGMGGVYRNLRSDRNILGQHLEPGTVRRVFAFARPHRRLIAGFLALTVVDAGLVVVTPLLTKRVVDDGILGHDLSLVVWLAVAMAVVAIVDAGIGIASGRLSSRIGEGLIFDLRTQVFAHV